MTNPLRIEIDGIWYNLDTCAAIKAGLAKPVLRPLTFKDVKVGQVFQFKLLSELDFDGDLYQRISPHPTVQNTVRLTKNVHSRDILNFHENSEIACEFAILQPDGEWKLETDA